MKKQIAAVKKSIQQIKLSSQQKQLDTMEQVPKNEIYLINAFLDVQTCLNSKPAGGDSS